MANIKKVVTLIFLLIIVDSENVTLLDCFPSR